MCMFLQDMLVPIDDLKDSLDCFHEEVEIYPIWLCPFKLPNNPPHICMLIVLVLDCTYLQNWHRFL